MRAIAIRLADGSFYPVLRGTQNKKQKLTLSTANPRQAKVRIDFYGSADESFSRPELVGSLMVDNQPADDGGEIEVIVGFDHNDSLVATAREPRSGSYESLSVPLPAAIGDAVAFDTLDAPPEESAERSTDNPLDELVEDDYEIDLTTDAATDETDAAAFDDLDLDDFALDQEPDTEADLSLDEVVDDAGFPATNAPADGFADEPGDALIDDLVVEDLQGDDLGLDDFSFDDVQPAGAADDDELEIEDLGFEIDGLDDGPAADDATDDPFAVDDGGPAEPDADEDDFGSGLVLPEDDAFSFEDDEAASVSAAKNAAGAATPAPAAAKFDLDDDPFPDFSFDEPDAASAPSTARGGAVETSANDTPPGGDSFGDDLSADDSFGDDLLDDNLLDDDSLDYEVTADAATVTSAPPSGATADRGGGIGETGIDDDFDADFSFDDAVAQTSPPASARTDGGDAAFATDFDLDDDFAFDDGELDIGGGTDESAATAADQPALSVAAATRSVSRSSRATAGATARSAVDAASATEAPPPAARRQKTASRIDPDEDEWPEDQPGVHPLVFVGLILLSLGLLIVVAYLVYRALLGDELPPLEASFALVAVPARWYRLGARALSRRLTRLCRRTAPARH